MAKRLIVCLDGTWNSPDQGPATNVVKLMRAIAPVDDQGVAQVTFYDAGIGADGGMIDRVIDGVTGRGLEQNVRDGYRFLANNWMPGDEIYVFGFSRGAFTARSLCGFIALVGLLPKREMDRLGEAWQLYRARQHDQEAVARIRSESRQGVKVTCLGVWDTVGALGVPGRRLLNRKHRFHNTELSKVVECAFHALAIDEKRSAFGPVLWQACADGSHEQKVIEQVWFPGAHSDVGGGAQDSGLAAAALSWMIRRVQAHSDLAFDEDYIDEHVTPDPLGEIHDPRSAFFALDRISPFQRPIGRRPVKRSLLRRLVQGASPADAGGAFVNEMIHWSAVARFGEMALEDGELRRYEPENLKAALGVLPVADERRQGPAPAPAPLPAPIPGPGVHAGALAEAL